MKIGEQKYRQVTVFVEGLETEIREEKGSFQRLVSEMKLIWMEEGEAKVAFQSQNKGIMKNPETKVEFQF